MITDDLIRKRFIHDTISQGINQIYAIQENVVQANLKTQSGQPKHISAGGLLVLLSPIPGKSSSSASSPTFASLTLTIVVVPIVFPVTSVVTWLSTIVQSGEFFITRLFRKSDMVSMTRSGTLSGRNWSRHFNMKHQIVNSHG